MILAMAAPIPPEAPVTTAMSISVAPESLFPVPAAFLALLFHALEGDAAERLAIRVAELQEAFLERRDPRLGLVLFPPGLHQPLEQREGHHAEPAVDALGLGEHRVEIEGN